MFIGIITYEKDIVETVKFETTDNALATQQLSDYVYFHYNRKLNITDTYFQGSLMNTNEMKMIVNTLANC